VKVTTKKKTSFGLEESGLCRLFFSMFNSYVGIERKHAFIYQYSNSTHTKIRYYIQKSSQYWTNTNRQRQSTAHACMGAILWQCYICDYVDILTTRFSIFLFATTSCNTTYGPLKGGKLINLDWLDGVYLGPYSVFLFKVLVSILFEVNLNELI